jgi:hypothetical protein
VLRAGTAAHYAKYFKPIVGRDSADGEVQFEWLQLRDAYKSFLDSIIIELCLPDSSTPPRILLQILNEAVEEAPREAKRFPQAMWDAVGDLSVRTTVFGLTFCRG